ncbi:hypothetical protein RJT34_24798 [Clitoria ternatea]|uniref:Chorein N-terminal domain-containing protein n=1 Tax=Clitoria ternatea TaxID=43366 RepID=A0AAN9FRC6_CLITE
MWQRILISTKFLLKSRLTHYKKEVSKIFDSGFNQTVASSLFAQENNRLISGKLAIKVVLPIGSVLCFVFVFAVELNENINVLAVKMFEGLVHQLLLGYLGRYFKDIQKEQLKIRLEVVLLENVELILDAFDYLQLPFALKQGRVGKLSIKIPWKKPWDPIMIILEDVFISASQRGDQEWSADAVEKREFAGKKAKLAAAELGKLSRRVCGSHAGQSFISHVTAKILDSIQVDIRNFHVLYSDVPNDLGHVMFGLKFTSLTMKQNLIGSSNGSVSMGHEHKIVEVKGLEFYSRMFPSSMDLVTVNSMGNSYSASNIKLEGEHYNSILAPCDVTLILSDNRSQKLDDNAPQYSVTAESSGVVISLDEVQLQHMLLVWDYICICRLREKYGRFRPWHCPLPRKCEGWQIYWWHYAQESVLADVRRKLKKSSWRYLGDRLTYRRKYMNLYKIKLDFLQHEQPVDDDVLQDLEQMEKESDLDDILNYRSAAEYEMWEFLSRCSTPNNGKILTDPIEKSCNDEHAVKSRGWLNWLSRGMLGAGGTDDSSQFSGVVSYDVKDISEATEFHPPISSVVDVALKDELCIFLLKFEIHQISATLCSKRQAKGIGEIVIEGVMVESKIYKENGIIITKFKSGKMVDPNNMDVFLLLQGPIVANNILDIVDHSCSIEVNFSSHPDVDMSAKVSLQCGTVGVLQQLEVTFDGNILSNLLGFFDVFTSFKFHDERIAMCHGKPHNWDSGVADCFVGVTSAPMKYLVMHRSTRSKVPRGWCAPLHDSTIASYDAPIDYIETYNQKSYAKLLDYHRITSFVYEMKR